jgi:HEAT repeat protein
MKKLLLLGALFAAGPFVLPSLVSAHGGTYRGPGDTVPPGGGGGGGGGGPASPGPAGPNAPGPSGPSSPSPASPGAPAGQPGGGPAKPTTGGIAAGTDLTKWQFWWGFNKDPYLNLKSKIHSGGTLTGSDDFFLGHGEKTQAKDSLRPSEAVIRGTVVPALLEALEKERSNDILTGAMIALAKIGDAKDEDGESKFEAVIREFLKDGNQEVAETAAIALGILANPASVPTLVELMKDTPVGRKLVGSTEVSPRSRAFAAYGLGLIGHSTNDNALRQNIAEHLIDVLESPHFSTRDIKVGCMSALGLIPIDVVADDATTPAEEGAETETVGTNRPWVLSRQTQLEYLNQYFKQENQRKNKNTRKWFVRAHAPTAMARLLTEDAPVDKRTEIIDSLLDAVNEHSKVEEEIQQSSILALGQIGDCDGGKSAEDKLDIKIREELVRILEKGSPQERRFSLIAMSQIGGRVGDGDMPAAGVEQVRKTLLKAMARGKSQLKPWSALSLGVMGRSLTDGGSQLDNGVSMALRSACEDEKAPDYVGAYCIALGLRNDLESKEIVLEKMKGFKGSNDTRGDAAIALGLMNDRSAIADIQDIIKNSKYKPELLKSAAIALGLLGDKELVDELILMLKDAKGLATQAAISSALGAIGDSRSIDPLVEMLKEDQHTDTARGFSAVALGIVCDKEILPWVSKISTNINYRANTTSLTGGGQGILDIL